MSHRALGRMLFVFAALFALATSAASGRADDAPAKNSPRPKVLILGDSISIGYTPVVKQNLKDIADVSRPKENCQHTAHGLAQIDKWLGKEKWDVIHFNWGIWDTHWLSATNELIPDEAHFKGESHIRHTPEQYRENLTKLVERMEKTGATLVWATTTPILSRTGKRFEDIKNLNAVADGVMRARGIPIDDLYEFSLPQAALWQIGDKVHFNAKGNEQLGKQVSDSVRQALQQRLKNAAGAGTEAK